MRDVISEDINPHPQELAWKKACDVCVFRTSNPQGLTDDEHASMHRDMDVGLLDLYCIHRTDEEGHHRRCACFAALYL